MTFVITLSWLNGKNLRVERHPPWQQCQDDWLGDNGITVLLHGHELDSHRERIFEWPILIPQLRQYFLCDRYSSYKYLDRVGMTELKFRVVSGVHKL